MTTTTTPRGARAVDGGEALTPTMKLKRAPVAAKYEAEIEAMYA
jgi:long-chain acyl-CoA synthetase